MDLNVTLKTWIKQATETSGYIQPLSLGWDIFTPIAEHSVIMADKDYELRPATGPVHVETKLDRFSESDLNINNTTLGQRQTFDVTSGNFDTINLNVQVSIHKAFPRIETKEFPADVLGHWLREFARIKANKYEDAFIQEIADHGTTGAAAIKKDADGKVLMYETLVAINRLVEENYWDKKAAIIYISPEIGEKIMLSDIQKNSYNYIQAEEIRYQGYIANFAGMPIVEVPRLKNNTSLNMLAVYKPQMFFYQYIDLPVTLGQAPFDYSGKTTILMKALEYFGTKLMNANSAFWFQVKDSE